MKNRPLFVISNREPYIHTKQGNAIHWHVPASGMVTAIEPIMRACGGTWIAHGSGDADRVSVDRNNALRVPPDDPKYTLRRVWLTKEEEKGYYDGLSNEGLWPLCHIAHTRPIFRKEDWYAYKKVNGKFAKTILQEIKPHAHPIILIQDFHFSLLPRMIKRARPDATVGLFWHIPWPNPESFSICPWKEEILDGMLGADLVGFHTQYHCNNFIHTVGRELESLVDWDQFTIRKNRHSTRIKPFPVSIAFPDQYGTNGAQVTAGQSHASIRRKLGISSPYIGIGVDRLDYTKGILERFKAIELFFEKHPFYKEKLTFIQIAAPTRGKVKRCHEFSDEVRKETERINGLLAQKRWKPIVLLEKHHTHEEVYTFYALAQFCMVTSLHDGMNLVAKEFVSARTDEKGVLILSQFAGAAQELSDALIVNPYDGEETAETIHAALRMPPSEQRRRMKRMREVVRNYNIYRWSAEFLKAMANVE